MAAKQHGGLKVDRKDWLIKQAVGHIREYDKNMDYQSKMLREQALAFFDRFMNPEQVALAIASSVKQEQAQQGREHHDARTHL